MKFNDDFALDNKSLLSVLKTSDRSLKKNSVRTRIT